MSKRVIKVYWSTESRVWLGETEVVAWPTGNWLVRVRAPNMDKCGRSRKHTLAAAKRAALKAARKLEDGK